MVMGTGTPNGSKILPFLGILMAFWERDEQIELIS